MKDTWRPEHSSGKSWIEESNSDAIENREINSKNIAINDIEQIIEQGLSETVSLSKYLLDNEIVEVECGDTVKYENIDESKIYTIKISEGPSDLINGIVNSNMPLAQALLGAVKGDEVMLQIPGAKSKTLKILEIVKNIIKRKEPD
jgi:transcription elongation GreA/GreB family factor